MVTAKISLLSNSPTCALIEITADEMEAREKLSSISACTTSTVQFRSLHYVKDGMLAMCHVLKTWRVNKISQILISRFDHNRENSENLLTAKISHPTVLSYHT